MATIYGLVAAENIRLNHLMKMMVDLVLTMVHFGHQCFHPSDVVAGKLPETRTFAHQHYLIAFILDNGNHRLSLNKISLYIRIPMKKHRDT